MSSELFDIRSQIFRDAFSKSQKFQEFLQTGSQQHVERWKKHYDIVQLSKEQNEMLSGFKRKMNVLVLAGIWCGDCAKLCPIIQKIAESSSVIDLRFIDNNQDATLRDELRIHGASRVPVVVTLSEDFFEINRFGDRTLATYRRKMATELGEACELGSVLPPSAEVSAEVSEWVMHFERLHHLLRLSGMLRKRYQD